MESTILILSYGNIRWKFNIDRFSKFVDGNDEKLGMSPSTNRDCGREILEEFVET